MMRQDLRFALRQLRKSPGFTATAVLMLALGLCASVAIFAFVDAALLAPLPYADQSRLVLAYTNSLQRTGRGMVSYLEARDWRDRARAFRSIDAYDVRTGAILRSAGSGGGAGSESQRVSRIVVTAGFFHTLGVTPALGRDFRADEEGNAAPPTVMLSYGAWQARFGGRPNIVGQTVTLDDEPHLIVGVLPREFHFSLSDAADFWTTVRGGNYCRAQRDCRSMQAIARLADGVTLLAATADLESVAQGLREQYPKTHGGINAGVMPLREAMLGDVQPILLVLLGGAGLLLMIACINVSSLLLVRADGRTREIAVRHALGASNARLVMQFVTESLLLVAAGSAIGLLLAMWGMQFLTSLLSADMLDRMPYLRIGGMGLNARILTFAGVVALFAGVVFTLTPLARMSMSSDVAGLKEGGRDGGKTTWKRLGAQLVIAELAIAVVLLVSAGLLTRSLQLLLRVDTGLNPDRLAIVSVSNPPDASKRSETLPVADLALARGVVARVAALPGVQAVSYADQLPISRGDAPTTSFRVPGRAPSAEEQKSHPIRRVGPGYFNALQARIVRGREFTEAEIASTRRVVIINQSAANRYFAPEDDPIGRELIIGAPPARLIVGVVADVKDATLEAPARPAAYVPFDQTSFSLVVRTSPSLSTSPNANTTASVGTSVSGEDSAAFPMIVAAIREVRPGLVISRISTMAERIDQMPSAYTHRSSAWLVSGFAALAFLLSVIGLYGVIAYSVSQRNREIGVRIALGADPASVSRLVLREAGWLTFTGIAIGLISAIAAASLMRGMLFGIRAWDLPTLAAVAITLGIAALLASYIPARRAASVNPIEALRAE
jgi:macrolide transport system ATP-binding/permease protein